MSEPAGGAGTRRRGPGSAGANPPAAPASAGPERQPRWERLEAEARREQILLCAKRLFTDRQYAAVSMEEISQAAGVRRGLVNHYFGSKRDLFMEVVRDLLSAFGAAFPLPGDEGTPRPVEEVVSDHIDRWMAVVEGDASTWFALVAAEGFGRDPDVARLVDRARDAMVEALVAILAQPDAPPSGKGRRSGSRARPRRGPDAIQAADDLRVVLRAYSGLAEVVTREWLLRKSIDRDQAHTLLTTALLTLVRDVVPALHPRN